MVSCCSDLRRRTTARDSRACRCPCRCRGTAAPGCRVQQSVTCADHARAIRVGLPHVTRHGSNEQCRQRGWGVQSKPPRKTRERVEGRCEDAEPEHCGTLASEFPAGRLAPGRSSIGTRRDAGAAASPTRQRSCPNCRRGTHRQSRRTSPCARTCGPPPC